jgi:6-pyruvoyltetrahydropterin/6-carboxytetrahydropterin synthase
MGKRVVDHGGDRPFLLGFMISLTRTVSFPATHRMWRPDWSEQENRAHFGPVAEYHGHQYACSVTVSGPLDPTTGMLVDLVQLDALIGEEVIDRLSGRQLNSDLPEFSSGRPLPTCEALASILYSRIAARLPSGLRLLRVRVAEDPTLYAEWTGEP